MNSNKRSRGKRFGYKNDHPLIVEKVAPESLLELRRLLQLPANKDLHDVGIKGATFSECIGNMAATLGIVLDGLYDGEALCELLVKAIKNRGEGKNIREADPRLVGARVTETEDSVHIDRFERGVIVNNNRTLEKIEDNNRFMREHGCIQCDNIALCRHFGKCLDKPEVEVALTKKLKGE